MSKFELLRLAELRELVLISRESYNIYGDETALKMLNGIEEQDKLIIGMEKATRKPTTKRKIIQLESMNDLELLVGAS